MAKYEVCSTSIVLGKKRNIYKKQGSTKQYIKSKGRMMQLKKYKALKAAKSAKSAKSVKSTSTKTTKRVKRPSVKRATKPKPVMGWF